MQRELVKTAKKETAHPPLKLQVQEIMAVITAFSNLLVRETVAQNSTKRLVNRILEAAQHAVVEEQQTNYSRHGRAATYKSATTSLSVDQSL
ncbi:MAG: hypothetical protein HY052_02950 [Proteobacteria bacterium]|nr:hypothetical protein [Pseudomonadota bacterium]